MRRWLGVLSLALLILGAGYAAIPWVARQAVEIWLVEQGFENPRFSISHPAWNEFRINEISLTRADAEQRISLHAGPVLIRYQPATLLFNHQLSDIQIPSASVHISYKPAIREDTPSTGELALLPLLPTRLIGKLPARRLLVGELALTLNTPGRPAWQFRGALDLTDHELLSRVHLRYGQEELGWSDLRFDDQQQFSFDLLYQDEPFIQLEGNIDQQQWLRFSFSQQIHLGRLRQWLSFIEPALLDWPAIDGKVRSQGYIQLPHALALSDNNWLAQLEIEQKLRSDIVLQQPLPELARLVFRNELELKLRRNILELTLAKNSRLLFQPDLPELPLPELTAQLNRAWQLAVPLHNPQQSRSELLDMQLNIPAIRHDNLVVHSEPLRLQLAPFLVSESTLEGSLQLPALRLNMPGQQLPVLALTQNFQLTPDLIQGQFRLQALDTPLQIEGSASWYGQRQQADVNWQLQPLGLKQVEHLIARYYPALPSELQIHAGLLKHRGWGRWQQGQLYLTLRQSIRDLRFGWDSLLGQQGQWRSELRLKPDGSWRDQGRLRLGLLDAGLPIENLLVSYEVRQSRQGALSVRLDNGQCQLLGGQVSMPQLFYQAQADRFEARVKVDRLQVDRLLELEQQKGLSGSGEVSGVLPVQYVQGQFSIKDGKLDSIPPGGFIRFQPAAEVAAVAGANPGLKMALEALQNFQYRQLNIGVDYQPDGTALLATRLQGYNPDWNNGRPVDLGINVEENIPKLLQALQITDQLTESLRKRYR
ncbi:MAG: YdbH domain-containing protein [Marinobacterium sp.]|nr:YdbH domain-containing protein [Marinobacterium sp.]